jgi:shikimate kinase/3-dehydroquinate synthase
MEEIGGRRALVLVGFMGSGKSTAAAAIARESGVGALDSDQEIERRAGQSVAEVFAKHGESGFRELEQQVVLELLRHADAATVVALGGGSVLSRAVQEALGEHVVVHLDVDVQSAWDRVSAEAGQRPLARDREQFAALHAARAPIYAALADAILPAGDPGLPVRAAGALHALRGAPAGTKLLWASAASGEYPVLIGRGLVCEGLVADVGDAARLWPLDRERSRPFCVTDANVSPLYRERLGELAQAIEIPAGESHKTIATAERVWSALLDAGATRADHVVALGGGVVGDLAGFCAATYQRGIRHVQVPTTLVAQVDSAYGGKTGVDLRAGKNYVGAYHQPSGVVVDPDTLGSLPPRELAAGWAEVLKTALIAGGELWRRVSAEQPPDERVVMLCAKTKVEIVARDERDAGARQMLNLGHTIGHAIETATGYRRYLHGEAVGLGLLAALRLSGAEDLREQVKELMAARGLPLQLQGASVADVLAAARHDKKRLHGDVPFVLCTAPGEVQTGRTLPQQQVSAAIAELSGQQPSGQGAEALSG